MTSAAEVQLPAREHVVYFYADDRSLGAVTARFLCAALVDGGAAIAIVTAAHRAVFVAELLRLGVDVDLAERAGSLVFLDARATLDQLLVDGAPDAGRFAAVITPAIAALAGTHRTVHAFGEMVGLLWDEGDVAALIALEELWNRLLAELPISLLCAYPATALADGAADSIEQVCAAHTDVDSALPVPADAQASRTFPKAPQSPGNARAFVAAALTSWDVEACLGDDAALVVTELAVNAIRHANSAFSVSLGRGDGCIRITVGDADPAPPARRRNDLRAASGRGLLLVDAVSAAWGSTQVDGGKLVWAEVGRTAEGRR
jgi:anti-sigma regulatory factor (Ser/Thr protein kinase)